MGLLYACSFPDHTFDDKKFFGATAAGGDGAGGDQGLGGNGLGGALTGGKSGASGHSGTGGSAGVGGGAGGSVGGTAGGAGGATGGTNGGTAGNVSAGGKSGSGGKAGTGGAPAGEGGGGSSGTPGVGGGGQGPGVGGMGGATGGMNTCPHDFCTMGEGLDPSCDPCAATVDASVSGCDLVWGQACIDAASTMCFGVDCGSGGTGGGGTSGTGGGGTTGGGGSGPISGGPCTATSDCIAGEACSYWDSAANVTKCEAQNPGGKADGETCAAFPAGDDECLSGKCYNFLQYPPTGYEGSKTCMEYCRTDSDCGDVSLKNICIDYNYPQPPTPNVYRQCMRKCLVNSDCPATMFCTLQEDVTDKRMVLVCDGPEGSGKYGDDVKGVMGCQTGMGTQTFTGDLTYCSQGCTTSADCPAIGANQPTCKVINYGSMSTPVFSSPIKSCFLSSSCRASAA